MSKPVIHIPLHSYLLDWFLFNNGGIQPIVPKRNTQIAMILTGYVTRKPRGWKYKKNMDGCVGFAIPQIHGKWAATWCYLPEEHVKRIQKIIRAQFCDQLFHTIRKDLTNPQKKITKMEFIYRFMKKNHIEESDRNYFAIDKIYSRMQKANKSTTIC